jgi:Tfp pilus assembly protein PilV
MKKANSESGFSILENVISVAIFTVGVLSISMLFTQTMTFTHFSEKMSVATNLARSELEELRNTPYVNIGSDSVSSTIDDVEYSISWVVTSDDPIDGVKKVVMRVEWEDLRGEQELEIETLISKY